MLRPWKVNLRDQIDASRPVPLHMQIVHALIRDIEGGRLTTGTFLPSSRDLAAALGVNRKTVVLAYEDLIAQGWLESAGTRGTMVCASLSQPVPARDQAAPMEEGADYDFARPPERSLAVPEGRGIKLDEGAPDGRLFPAELLVRAFRHAITQSSLNNGFQYRDPRGTPALRASIADMLRSERGLMVEPDNICITRGSQHAMFLAAKVLIRPGDCVIVEELTYEPAVAAFRSCGAKVIPVPLDGEGIDAAAVEQVCRRERVRAVFLTPHHQFPTTIALRPHRRLRILDLARQFGFAVIEDDYDHEFHFQGQPLLPMAAYAPRQVIYVGSLSKLLLPALRIGYLVAPVAVIDAVAHMVSLVDGMGSTVTEQAAHELIESGELRRHARKVRPIYARRRASFAAALDRHFGDSADYTMPDGGLAFWLRFRDPAMLDRIEAKAPARGLRFAASASFQASDQAPRGLRLGFASLGEQEARDAVATLRALAN